MVNMNNKIKSGNYYTIQSFMRNDLKLKGNELNIYAIIFGFTQDDESWFTGSLTYLQDWLGVSKNTVRSALDSLVEKGYIFKDTQSINGIVYNRYKNNYGVSKIDIPTQKKCTGVSKFGGGVSKIDTGVYQNLEGGVSKIDPNNKEYNILDNINNNIYSAFDAKKAFELFWEIYPRKINKKKAEEKFLKVCKNEETFNKIIEAVKLQTKTEQWKDVQYIPHPTTWLNGERWNDEVNVKNKSYSNIGEVLG